MFRVDRHQMAGDLTGLVDGDGEDAEALEAASATAEQRERKLLSAPDK